MNIQEILSKRNISDKSEVGFHIYEKISDFNVDEVEEGNFVYFVEAGILSIVVLNNDNKNLINFYAIDIYKTGANDQSLSNFTYNDIKKNSIIRWNDETKSAEWVNSSDIIQGFEIKVVSKDEFDELKIKGGDVHFLYIVKEEGAKDYAEYVWKSEEKSFEELGHIDLKLILKSGADINIRKGNTLSSDGTISTTEESDLDYIETKFKAPVDSNNKPLTTTFAFANLPKDSQIDGDSIGLILKKALYKEYNEVTTTNPTVSISLKNYPYVVEYYSVGPTISNFNITTTSGNIKRNDGYTWIPYEGTASNGKVFNNPATEVEGTSVPDKITETTSYYATVNFDKKDTAVTSNFGNGIVSINGVSCSPTKIINYSGETGKKSGSISVTPQYYAFWGEIDDLNNLTADYIGELKAKVDYAKLTSSGSGVFVPQGKIIASGHKFVWTAVKSDRKVPTIKNAFGQYVTLIPQKNIEIKLGDNINTMEYTIYAWNIGKNTGYQEFYF